METEQLEKDIRALKARRLEPLETQMHRSWQAGEVEETSELARRLLSLMPENKAARKILGDIEKKTRQNQIKILLQRAREARDRRDFEREAGILTQILAMGKRTPRLKRLLAEAQRQALHQREKAEADALAERVGSLKDHPALAVWEAPDEAVWNVYRLEDKIVTTRPWPMAPSCDNVMSTRRRS